MSRVQSTRGQAAFLRLCEYREQWGKLQSVGVRMARASGEGCVALEWIEHEHNELHKPGSAYL
jgi:hypothetical protein